MIISLETDVKMIIILIELLIAILFTVLVIITFHKRDIKMNILFFSVILCVSVITIFLTIFFEMPRMSMNDVLEVEFGNGKIVVIPKTRYFFKDITDMVKCTGKINYNKLGEYEIEYDVPILFNRVYKKTQIIKIVDRTAPEIILNGEEELKLNSIAEYTETGATARDNYDGNISKLIKIEEEQISPIEIDIKYTVSDTSGNIATKIRKIHLIDTVAPEITLNGKSKIVLELGEEYIEEGVSAIDDKDGDITDRAQVEGIVDTSTVGNYLLKYKVADTTGNEAVTQRIVVVISKKAEEEECEESKKGVIYLTFDDGPNANTTPKILDILQEKGIKATFFILNYDENEAQYVKREFDEGHTVAIHGYSHEYKIIYQSKDAYMENITKLQEKIKETTGQETTIIRFPGGSSNTISSFNPGIMTLLTNEVLVNGYRYFDWNVDSDDAGSARNSKDVYKNVIKGLSKERANVVLMHDSSGNNKTVEALPYIIEYGLENGYTFERITETTPMVTHRVFN